MNRIAPRTTLRPSISRSFLPSVMATSLVDRSPPAPIRGCRASGLGSIPTWYEEAHEGLPERCRASPYRSAPHLRPDGASSWPSVSFHAAASVGSVHPRSEEHTSELQSRQYL